MSEQLPLPINPPGGIFDPATGCFVIETKDGGRELWRDGRWMAGPGRGPVILVGDVGFVVLDLSRGTFTVIVSPSKKRR
jgi:hypothetical protein